MERIEDGNPRSLNGIHTTTNEMFQESVINYTRQWEKQRSTYNLLTM